MLPAAVIIHGIGQRNAFPQYDAFGANGGYTNIVLLVSSGTHTQACTRSLRGLVALNRSNGAEKVRL